MFEPGRFTVRAVAGPLAVTAALAGVVTVAINRESPRVQAAAAPPLPRVAVVAARSEAVPRDAQFTGRIEAIHRVELRARVSGLLERVMFTEGADVTAGTPLFQLDLRPFENARRRADAEVAALEARVTRARDEYARAEKLADSDAVAIEELERRRSELATLTAQQAAAAAAAADSALQLEWATVTAPVSGVVGRAAVTAGNLVTGGTADGTLLATLHSLDPVYVYFDLDPTTADAAAAVPSAKWRAFVVPFEGGNPVEGRIDFLDNGIGPQTGTRTIRARIPNPGARLLPGAAVRVTFRYGTLEDATVVPDVAIGSEQGVRHVLVARDDDTLETRPVSTGVKTGAWRVVQGGTVRPGERIVLPGAPGIRAGMKVTPVTEVLP